MPDLADPQQRIRPSGPNGEKSPEFWQELKKLYDYVRQIVPSGSGGDVVGPSGVTANAPALFNGTTGKIIKAGTLNQLVPTSGAANGLFLGFAGGIPAWLANTFTIADGSITLAKITNIPAGTFLARKVADGAGPPETLTPTEARAELGVGTGTGDVVGPASVVADRVALFNGTTGKIIKAGTANQLVPTTAVNGQFLGFASGAPTWQGIVTGSGDVSGPNGVNPDRVALFDGASGKLIKQGTATQLVPTPTTNGFFLSLAAGIPTWQAVTPGTGDVVGPSTVVDSRVALFDGTSGKLIKQGTATQLVPTPTTNGFFLGLVGGVPTWQGITPGTGDVVGPASVVADRVALFNGTTGKLIKAGTAIQLVPTPTTNGFFLGLTGGVPTWQVNTPTIANGSITLPMLANQAGGTFLARKLADGSGQPFALTAAEARLELGIIRPEDFGLGTDALNLSAAFAAGISTGLPVRLDGNYTLSAALPNVAMTTGTLTVRGHGNINITADMGVAVTITATYPTAVAVTAVTQTTRAFPGTATDTINCTQITAAGHGCTVGDLIKIVSDNQIAPQAAANHRQGEFCYVADVSGNDLFVAGYLMDTYTTTVRMVRVRTEAKLIWDGPTFSATPNQFTWSPTFLMVRNFAFPRIRTGCASGYSQGLYISSCYMADVDVYGIEMTNRISSAASNGYLIADMCSAYSTVRLRSVDARHAYTTGTTTSTTSDQAYLYGRTYGFRVTGTATGSSAAGFDAHSEARDGIFYAVQTGGGRAGENGSGIGVQLRGISTRLLGGNDFMSPYGVDIHVQAAGDCIDNEIVDWNYNGLGDGFRFNFPSAAFQAIRPRARGGRIRTSFTRCAAAWFCDGGIIEDYYFAPIGATASMEGLYVGDNAELLIRNLNVDLSGYTGSTFRVFGIHAAGSSLTVESVNVTGAAGKLQAWITGGSNTGTVILNKTGLKTDAAPSSGDIINGGSLTVTYYGAPGSQIAAAAPVSGTWARGDMVWNSLPSAAGKIGFVCTTAGTPGTWKAWGAIDA